VDESGNMGYQVSSVQVKNKNMVWQKTEFIVVLSSNNIKKD
jgi:hypothetical protein